MSLVYFIACITAFMMNRTWSIPLYLVVAMGIVYMSFAEYRIMRHKDLKAVREVREYEKEREHVQA